MSVGQEHSRQAEIARYVAAYRDDAPKRYGMGRRRQADVWRILHALAIPGRRTSLLDIGTGRGETLAFAAKLGYQRVAGTEVVPELIGGDVVHAQAHELPFDSDSFDHITCFDVLEHLLAEDLEPALREMHRVARCTITVSASVRSSEWPGLGDLHISARPANEWRRLMKACWTGEPRQVGRAGGSPCFQLRKS